ncbi:thiamine ABC transporter substrate-binding protein [Caloranaerobacter azorensis H53214]|uniref:Thiamine ABC transporter substrate-binding protein n=1 Tax=Caloranaerobacter azorensis H53214 TaxID=1156417 RepID=A0A096DPR1_9FIRM|nr:ABC-F family ATP-binding cassette domain-containing protein [Caloranaerobacter azorensis]KGG81236.1 thiamine ABC transporter substrate-binding protein [Caloranaerobacter azorensis H53214]
MIVLSCSNLSKSYSIYKILDNISFTINDGEKIGLVGLNGTGKSTLFKILAGKLSKDSGEIYIAKDHKIGFLEQNTQIESNNTVFEETLKVFRHLIDMEKKLRNLEEEISIEGKNGSSAKLQNLMNLYSKLIEEFNDKNGYGYKSEIKGVLKGLGFTEEEFNKPINKLSGGQKARISLAKLLLEKPNILLLDEPTNHLDIEAIDWLEKFIKDYRGTVIVISHDRYFLDSVTNRIFLIENSTLKSYNGNYSTFMKKRKKELELLQKKYEEQQKEIKRQEEIIKKFMSYGGKRYIRQAQSRQKMLDKMKKIDKPVQDHKKAKIIFEPKVKSGYEVLKVRDLSMNFDDFNLFKDLCFSIYRGEKVGLIGPNGIGKTTLFKIILNKITPTSGEITLGHHVNIGYYDQEQSNLNPEKTIVDEIWDENPNLDHYQIRSVLAKFLFHGDNIFKEISTLSGGEKSRLALLKLMLSKANFLLMDEPTNHLDIDSKEVLEDALKDYEGTLLVISHDRYFLNKVTDKILELNSNGIKEYLGNYDYYLNKKKANEIQEEISDDKTKTQIKAERKRLKEQQKKEKKLKERIKNLESKISQYEEKISELEKYMCKPEVFNNPTKSIEISTEVNNLKNELNKLYDEWMELTDN